MKLSLGFSPCPNDCFIFDAIVHQRIDLEGLAFDLVMEDVEALNRLAFNRAIDVTKLSYHAFAHCADAYVLLDAGSALGRGCGPLLISSRHITPEDVAAGGLRIAIPGKYTTANLLLRIAFPEALNKCELVFSQIEAAVLRGDADAGVIIHENRFTYEAKGLKKIVDLGEFWEANTGMPIPLGGIVIKRSLPDDVRQTMNRVLRRSVEHAFANPGDSAAFVRDHAQEMSRDVIQRHIDLYVNEYSVDLGAEGRRAIEVLFDRARLSGVVKASHSNLFVSALPTPPESDAPA